MKLEDLADTVLSQKISQLPGVGLVSISGGQKPAVRIQANPTALASYGLSLEDLRTALAQANVNQAKGNLDGPRQHLHLGNDQLLTSDAYKPIVIAYKNGAPVRIMDVANVVDGAENVKQAPGKTTSRRNRQHSAATRREHHQRGGPHPESAAAVESDAALVGPGFDLTDRTTTIRASVKMSNSS